MTDIDRNAETQVKSGIDEANREPSSASVSATERAVGAASKGRLPPQFLRLFGASFLSNLGDGLSIIAFPWLATTITTNPVAVAAVAMFSRLPWLVFSLPAGAIIDRYDRRRIMVATNTARFVVLAIVSAALLLDAMSLPMLYVSVLALGCAEVMFDSATIVIIPSLVEPRQLDRANGLVSGAQGVANDFLGAPAAGLLLSVALVLPFIGHSLAAGVSALLIAFMVGTYRTDGNEAAGAPAGPRTRLRTEVADGMRWLWHHELLRTLAVTTAVIGATTWSFLATFVLFGQEILGMGSRGYGFTMAVGGLGMVLGSVLVPWLSRWLGRGRVLALTLVLPGLLFLLGAVTSNAVVVAAVFLLWGILIASWNVITVSLRQILIPGGMLGRVASVYRFLGVGSASVGILAGSGIISAVAALAGRELGLRTPFLVAAVAHLVLFLVALRSLTEARIQAAIAQAAAPAVTE